MKIKVLGLVAVAVMAISLFSAAGASATTLEENGTAKNSSIFFNTELISTAVIQLTGGSSANSCLFGYINGLTSAYTGSQVSGSVTGLRLTQCKTEPIVVDKTGSFSIEWINGTTNGTVRLAGLEMTVPSPIGSLNCKTGEGVDVGTLTGVKTGFATLDFKAVVNCGIFAPSATWSGTYSVSTPNLGVTS